MKEVKNLRRMLGENQKICPREKHPHNYADKCQTIVHRRISRRFRVVQILTFLFGIILFCLTFLVVCVAVVARETFHFPSPKMSAAMPVAVSPLKWKTFSLFTPGSPPHVPHRAIKDQEPEYKSKSHQQLTVARTRQFGY